MKILIVNGSGGVGKDTFVSMLAKYVTLYHVSIVDPIKELARAVGWDGGKTEKDRKFLAELKSLVDNYNDFNYKYIENITSFCETCDNVNLLCIDMREPDQIQKFVAEYGAKTLIVTNDSVEQITTNHADAGVFEYKYDYAIQNSGTLKELEDKAKDFARVILGD